ncbi:predicted protein [Sclerotinia sclerotiorum 1980 UF-70]|uniref:Uncharacterized protein n=1 Tax=Sclerotinia sclerotiorum (strain ATCC 18683 / 1980 / Ss-1) TaxID=665079 RepID=A7EFJ2_SCLS1|nr:predicted protein [Sclerotinia sclerotiorum 1980 UF-70]EDO01608.1 predicted protein [Sclerotinia sclerotiorum 1980 UF-70]
MVVQIENEDQHNCLEGYSNSLLKHQQTLVSDTYKSPKGSTTKYDSSSHSTINPGVFAARKFDLEEDKMLQTSIDYANNKETIVHDT